MRLSFPKRAGNRQHNHGRLLERGDMTRIAFAVLLPCTLISCSRSATPPMPSGARGNSIDPPAADWQSERRYHFTKFAAFCFPQRADARRAGEQLLAILESSADSDALPSFIGRDVVFAGGGAGNADLIVGDGVRLEVIITPARDVRPQSVSWEACVLGIVRRVDRSRKVITIEARPDEWRVGDTT
jgi:hypothetical protein